MMKEATDKYILPALVVVIAFVFTVLMIMPKHFDPSQPGGTTYEAQLEPPPLPATDLLASFTYASSLAMGCAIDEASLRKAAHIERQKDQNLAAQAWMRASEDARHMLCADVPAKIAAAVQRAIQQVGEVKSDRVPPVSGKLRVIRTATLECTFPLPFAPDPCR